MERFHVVRSGERLLPPAAVLLAFLGLLASALAMVTAPPARAATATPVPAPAGPVSPVRLSLPGVSSGGSDADLEGFLTAALTDVDAFWTKVLARNGYDEPTVTYAWIPAGRSVVDACSGQPSDVTAAFYCPVDDTIYLSEPFMAAVRDGRLSRWPSGDRTSGALGDMAVAYVVAHEEAHNIQNELGFDDGRVSTQGLELHADCLAGAWAANAASRGVVNTQDVEEAQVTAWLVGDYAFDDPGHHGTPAERRDAFTAGYESLGSCRHYLT